MSLFLLYRGWSLLRRLLDRAHKWLGGAAHCTFDNACVIDSGQRCDLFGDTKKQRPSRDSTSLRFAVLVITVQCALACPSEQNTHDTGCGVAVVVSDAAVGGTLPWCRWCRGACG